MRQNFTTNKSSSNEDQLNRLKQQELSSSAVEVRNEQTTAIKAKDSIELSCTVKIEAVDMNSGKEQQRESLEPVTGSGGLQETSADLNEEAVAIEAEAGSSDPLERLAVPYETTSHEQQQEQSQSSQQQAQLVQPEVALTSAKRKLPAAGSVSPKRRARNRNQSGESRQQRVAAAKSQVMDNMLPGAILQDNQSTTSANNQLSLLGQSPAAAGGNSSVMKQKLEQNICAACLRPIKERYLLVALDKQWHEDCLKCACCDCRLGEVGSSLFTHSDKILCRRDFLRIFGQPGHCAACKKSIPPYELVMRANQLAYHMDCFACQNCQYRFCVGDHFHLTELHLIVCTPCHTEQQQPPPQQQNLTTATTSDQSGAISQHQSANSCAERDEDQSYVEQSTATETSTSAHSHPLSNKNHLCHQQQQPPPSEPHLFPVAQPTPQETPDESFSEFQFAASMDTIPNLRLIEPAEGIRPQEADTASDRCDASSSQPLETRQETSGQQPQQQQPPPTPMKRTAAACAM